MWYNGRGPIPHFSMWIPTFQALFDEFFLLVNDLQCHRSLIASFHRCVGFSLSSLFILFHWSIFFIPADTVLITICIIMSLTRWWKKSLHLIRWEEVLAVPGFLHFHLCFRINILEKKQQPHLLWILVGIALNQSIINLMRIWHLSILSLLAQEHDLSSFKSLNEVWQLPPHKTYLSFIRCNPMFIKFLFLL